MYNKILHEDKILYKKATKEIRAQIKAYGIRVHKKKFRTNVGRAWSYLSLVKLPIIQNIESLYIIFHEIAHIKYGHAHKKWDYIEELQAEIYALSQLRKIGVKEKYPLIYKKIHYSAKEYVMLNIMYDIEMGLKTKNIIQSALRFCNLKK